MEISLPLSEWTTSVFSHEVPSTTTTYFIYQTSTYTEPRVSNGGGYAVALDKTPLESQYLDVFTDDIVTLDFQVSGRRRRGVWVLAGSP